VDGPTQKLRWFAIGIFAVPILVLAVDLARYGDLSRLYHEGSGIELASFLLLAYGCVGFLVLAPQHAFGRVWHVPVGLFLLASRELDLDKRFLADGMLKSNLYRHDNPISHKLIGGAVVILILWVIWRHVRRSGPGWVRSIFGLQLWAWLWLLAMASIVIARSLDGLKRKLLKFGIEVSRGQASFAAQTEEILELAFAMLTCLSIAYWLKWRAAGT